MLLPDLPILSSPQAEEDFADILQHTMDCWGEAQVYLYRAVLDEAFLTLQRHPQIGRACPELSMAHRVLAAGRHIIIYRVGESCVYIVRILHERMDVGRHL